MSAPPREVPKFSSFRAKKPVPQEQPTSRSTTLKRRPSVESDHGPAKTHRSAERPERSSHRHHISHEHQVKTSDTHHRDRNSHEPHQHRRPVTNTSSNFHHDGNSDLFVVDLKGDQQNVAYDRLHKYSIPTYHRVGYGGILGLHTRFKIDRAESTLDKVLIADKSAISKQVPQRLLLKRQRNQELSALHVHNEHELNLTQDFVALSPSADHHDTKSVDDPFNSFKDLDQAVDADPHRFREHEILDVASAADLQVRQQNVQFVRATKSDPSNLQAWLDLANHQEHLVSPGADAHSLSNVERQTLADMRIAVYEKALKHFPTSEAAKRERLVLGLFHEASVAWDAQKYMSKLQGILQQHPESFPIWSLYLDACQTNPIDFRFEDVKAFFVRSIRTLGLNANSGHEPDSRRMVLYLILRYTVFLLDTGYDELSIAIWQALGEYHLFRPEHLASRETGHVLTEFEQFWENESPRFGEVGARGWRAVIENDELTSSIQRLPPKDQMSSNLPFKSFAALETNMSKFFQFPGRTMDEAGADDPFHVVLFSDIRDILEATASGLDHYDLLDAILCYLGLPSVGLRITPGNDTQPRPEWRSDVFLRHGLLQSDFSMNEILFSRMFRGLSASALEQDASSSSSTQAATHFARRTLSSMVKEFPNDDDLAEYHLAFELSCFPKEATKVAKQILKQRPSSLRLYNACATIEAKLGKFEKAAQIWSGAINMKDSFSHASQEELVLLWRGWIWCDLEANQPQRALSHLASFGSSVDLDGSKFVPPTTATLLRLRNAFKDGFEHSLSLADPRLAALNVEMLALVAYLTEPDALQASVDAVNEQCNAAKQKFAHQHVLIELLHQVKAGIVAYHIRQKRAYRPAFVRFELETSIAHFPDNTIFLEMYRDNEVQFLAATIGMRLQKTASSFFQSKSVSGQSVRSAQSSPLPSPTVEKTGSLEPQPPLSPNPQSRPSSRLRNRSPPSPPSDVLFNRPAVDTLDPAIATSDDRKNRRRSWFGRSKSTESIERGPKAWVIGHPERRPYDLGRLAGGEQLLELWDETADCEVHLFPRTSGKGPSFRIDSALLASSKLLSELVIPFKTDFDTSTGEPHTPPMTPKSESRSQLFLPITLKSDIALSVPNNCQGLSSDEDTLVTTRNLFAFLAGESLVATQENPTVFSVFIKVSESLKQFGFSNFDGSTFGEVATSSFDKYVDELGLADVRSSREKTIETLILGERMKSIKLYNEAFTHASGKYDELLKSGSPKFRLISPISANRLGRAAMDLEKRTASVRHTLEDFDFPQLFSGFLNSKTVDERKDVDFDVLRDSFLATRKFVISYYKIRFGSWPPKASKKNELETSGLNRIVCQELYHDFCAVYDFLVDRTSLTNRTADGVLIDDRDADAPRVRALRAVL
ncbi:DUF1740-domain-containing protein, partial [Aureobasidium melanogenum]